MSTSAFTGFVLLNEAKFDRDKFLKDLKEDWKITLNLGEENKEKDMLVGNIDDIMVAVALMPAPIPDNEAVEGDNMRENYINWDSYFMGIAILSSMRSKDPNTQVGACIVNEDKRIVGVGYNGLPKGCDDKEFPWQRDGEFLNTKYPYVCHAELNAILNSIKSLKDCIIYVALFPCHECTKAIIQSGIKEIVYLSDKYTDTDSNRASKKMLDSAGVKYRRFEPDIEKLEINFANIE